MLKYIIYSFVLKKFKLYNYFEISLESTRPGVSKNTNCVSPMLSTARALDLVVWTLHEYGHIYKTQ